MNKMYGFEGEVQKKYSSQMVELFTEVFNYLPLAHIIGGKILVRLYMYVRILHVATTCTRTLLYAYSIVSVLIHTCKFYAQIVCTELEITFKFTSTDDRYPQLLILIPVYVTYSIPPYTGDSWRTLQGR